MNWAEENNYTTDYEPIISNLPEYDVFQEMPSSFAGTIEDWHKELDDFEPVAREEYLEICKKIYIAILDENRLE